jgi:FkbH-like protein
MSGATVRDALQRAKAAKSRGGYKAALAELHRAASPADDFAAQAKLSKFFKELPKDALGLKEVKIAVIATSTVSHLSDALAFWLSNEGIRAHIHEAEYDTLTQTILDPASALYAFSPEIVIFFTNYRDVRCAVTPGSSADEVQRIVRAEADRFRGLWDILRERMPCTVIQNNADAPSHRVFGNFEGTAAWGSLNVLRLFNLSLAAAAGPGVVLFDLDFISSCYGKQRWHEQCYWYHSKHAFAPDATGMVAYSLARLIAAAKGLAKKCLVLDLDNTLWGGEVGDDGVEGIRLGHGAEGEAFVDFQIFILGLKSRGIVLAVCSRNDDQIAREAFRRHPDMRLKLDDFVVFKANWNDKAANIRAIAAELGLGLDSLVFVDDNPAERELVRRELPMVEVPELPLDPSDFRDALSSLCCFETVSFGAEDRDRSELYRANLDRHRFQEQCTDLAGYLASLEMEAEVLAFDDLHLPRIAQLINKSNQFNLTTTRYGESELLAFRQDPAKRCLAFKLKDRFGDNGLISAVILVKRGTELHIDTWVMSCRVLARGMEEFVIAEIAAAAKGAECVKIVGRYAPTEKNRLVADLYERLAFSRVGRESNGTTVWELGPENRGPRQETAIRRVFSGAAGQEGPR